MYRAGSLRTVGDQIWKYKLDLVSDKMSYIILRRCWCDIIILNVHVPREDKIDDMKDRFYEELEYVFDNFPK
jgi:hypothetical protein